MKDNQATQNLKNPGYNARWLNSGERLRRPQTSETCARTKRIYKTLFCLRIVITMLSLQLFIIQSQNDITLNTTF